MALKKIKISIACVQTIKLLRTIESKRHSLFCTIDESKEIIVKLNLWSVYLASVGRDLSYFSFIEAKIHYALLKPAIDALALIGIEWNVDEILKST